jgi:hypothetical protein
MKTKPTDGKSVGRRDFLRGISAGAIGGTAMLTTAPFVGEALAGDETADERRKPRYNANSPDIQAFYRVNHYPATKK